MANKTQTTKKVLKSTNSFALDTLDAASFYDASLIGNDIVGSAHQSLKKINSTLTGDSLSAIGNNSTLLGGAGNDSLLARGTGNVLIAGSGQNTLVSSNNGGANFVLGNSTLLAGDSVSGGNGVDTLTIGKAATIADSQFSRVRGVEVLSLTKGNSVTLGATVKQAGINFVKGGDGNSSYLQETGANQALTIAAGSGKDRITLAEASLLATDSLSGGDGADTLGIAAAGSVTDELLSKVSGIEVLSLSGASSLTLGGSAQAAGIRTVIGGSLGGSFTQTPSSTEGVLIVGGAGNDTFNVSGGAQLASDTIVAGAGTDLVRITTAGTVEDESFARVSGVEALSLTSASVLTVGKAAAKAGITTVYGGSSNDTIIQDAGYTNALNIIGGGSSDLIVVNNAKLLAKDVIKGGDSEDTLAVASEGAVADSLFGGVSSVEVLSLTGASSVVLNDFARTAGFTTVLAGEGNTTLTQGAGDTLALTLVGGSGDDLVNINNAALLAADSITGGAGQDTLTLATEGSVADENFNRLSSVEELALTGASAVTLGSAVSAAGISTVRGGKGDSTFTQTAGAVNLIAGGGNDLITVSDSTILAGDTITGGSGADTLAVAAAATLADGAFANISKTEVLALTGASSVELGATAQAAGIVSVIGGSGASTFTQTSDSTVATTISGGSASDVVSLAGSAQLLKDSISGGAGEDTLIVASGATLGDTAFSKVASVENLVLTDESAVTLGSAAQTTGIISVTAGAGNTTILQTAGSISIAGGAGDDRITLKDSALLAGDVVSGGSGADTLVLGSEGSFADSAFSSVSGVENLALTGASSITLAGSVQGAGIGTVYGGAGNSSYDWSGANGPVTIFGGKGADLFNRASDANLSSDSVVGGAGVDTLKIAGSSNLADGDFANVLQVEVLTLDGGSSVELDGTSAAAGIMTLLGDNGNETISVGEDSAAKMTVSLGGGDDVISVTSAAVLARNTYQAGQGSDTLTVSNEEFLTDKAFSKASGIEILSLTGSSAVTLGAAAERAGILSVIGGTGDTTLTQAVSSRSEITLDASGSSSALFAIANTGQLANDVVIGSQGEDTVAITSATKNAEDSTFAGISGVEVLSLTGASAVTLGDNAQSAGIETVLGGSGSNSITQDSGSFQIIGQSGRDLISLATGDLLSGNVIDGGDGSDTLSISSGAELTDDNFANVQNIENLNLSESSSVELGTAVASAGIVKVIGGSGDSTFTQTDGAFTLQAGEGNDLFAIDNADLLAADTIRGGEGTDTLLISSDSELADEAFTQVKGVEVLDLTGSNSVTLGAAAKSSGLQTIDGGDSDSTYVQSAGSLNIIAGSGNDQITVSDTRILIGDTITGGDGEDTLTIGTAGKLNDDNFANVLGVEVVQLTDSSSIALGANSATSEIATVLGGAGSTTISHLEDGPGSLYIDAVEGGGSANLLEVANADIAAADTFVGSGSDTLSIVSDSTIDDTVFTNITGVVGLKLGGASTVSLDAVQAAGILTVAGGNGESTYTQESAPDALTLVAGSGNDFISVADSTFLANESLIGGLGIDTLALTQENTTDDPLVLDDAAFSGLSGIEVITLSGAAQVTLDEVALASGVRSILTADADNVFTQGVGQTNGLTLQAGAGNDLFSIATDKQLTMNSLVGGDGQDTLQILAGEDSTNKIVDRNFARFSGFEVLSLGGNNSVALGELATEALTAPADAVEVNGITAATVIAASAETTLDANNYGASIIIDASANADGADYLAGSGTEASMIIMAGADAVASSTIKGGSSEADTLTIAGTDGYTFEDEYFANVSKMDVLALGEGDNVLTLGGNAGRSGLLTVVGGVGNTTLTQTASNNKQIFVDGSNSASNYFQLDYATLAGHSLTGGTLGADTVWSYDTLMGSTVDGFSTLEVSRADEGGYDEIFTNITGVQFLSLTAVDADGNNASTSVTLAGNALNSGLQTIAGSGGDISIVQTGDAAFEGGLVIDATAANSLIIDVATQDQAILNTITGGDNIDTFVLQEGTDVIDDAFANKASLEVLSLVEATSLTLGANAVAMGISSVFGGASNVSITQTADAVFDNGLYLIGENNDGVAFNIATAEQLATDTIDGSTGNNDTLIISEPDLEISDDALANTTGIEVLQVTGNTVVNLGDNAAANGLQSVILGEGGDATISQTNGAFVIDGSTANSLIVTMDTAELAASNTIIGGEGVDTLALANEGEVTDEIFADKTGLDVLSLIGASNLTLGANAAESGLLTVVGGEGDGTISQTEDAANALVIDGSLSSSNIISIDTVDLATADTIIGGDGVDTLQIANEGEVTDDVFADKTSLDVFALSGSSNLTLGANAAGDIGLLTVVGGEGDSTITQTADAGNALVIDGSLSSSNLITVDNADLALADTIVGGGGEDTLVIATEGEILDDVFENKVSLDVIALTGASNLTLGANAAGDIGLLTVVGGDGDSTITQTADAGNALYIDGSAANSNLISVDNADLALADTIVGGGGEDTLVIATEGEISDDVFANKESLDVLALTGASNLTLGGNAAGNIGLLTVVGGDGDSTITQTADAGNALYIDGSVALSNLITVDNVELALADTIVGGDGVDTLVIATEGEILDDVFENKVSLDVLTLTGASNLTLGANAAGDIGLLTVVGGDGDSTITQTADAANALYIDGSVASSNLITVDNADLALADTIVGGDGVDTLVIANEGEILDDVFENKVSLDVLTLTGASNLTLGANAAGDIGLLTVVGGDGDSTITQTADAANALYIDGSVASSNLITVDNADLALADTIVGGDGVDTLVIANEGEILDDVFENKVSLDVLTLTGASNLTLGAYAAGDIGLLTVVGGDGDSTITQTADAANALYIDGSVASSNLISVDNADLALADTIVGGDGEDTLVIANEGEILDDVFENKVSLDVLALTGTSNLTLGANAAGDIGLLTVVGGDGDSTITQTADATNALYIDGSAANSNLISVDNADLALADTIVGGDGEDTLVIANEGEILDDVFENKVSLDVLALTGTSSLTLGANAAGDIGLLTVVGGDGDSTITQTADATNALYIDGSVAASNLITVDNAEIALNDTIVGGDGEDTLVIANEGEISDEVLANKASIDILALTGASNLTLGANAAVSGLLTIVGGDGDTSLTHAAENTNAVYFDGSVALSNLITVDNAELATDDTLVGGEGIDTLAIASEGEILDDVFANKVSIDVLSLTGASNLTLGANASGDMGLLTVVGGDGDSTITQTADATNALYIDGSASASNLIILDNVDQALVDTIAGGDGEDTLAIGNEGELADDAFAAITGIEVLTLAGSSSIELGSNAGSNGLLTVVGGSEGDSTISQSAGAFYIDGSASGSNLIQVSDAELVAGDTIVGGSGANGADTLTVASGDVIDDIFANVSGIEVLGLGDSGNATLGANAVTSGISSVLGGSGDVKVTQNADNTNALVIDASANSSASFVIDSAVVAANNTITGSAGTDTLTISTPAAAGDELFANATGIEVLSLTGGNSIVIGDNAVATGIVRVIAGEGGTDLTQNAGAIDFDGTASSQNAITVSTGEIFSSDSLAGGAGTDVVTIQLGTTLSDDAFANKSGLEVLNLAESNSIELGANAAASGITSVTGGAGDNTFSQTADNALGLNLDGSSSNKNLFSIATATQLASDTLSGSENLEDTLQVGEGTLDDAAFTNVKGVEYLGLSGSSSVLLAEAAMEAGFSTIIGGAGSTTITQTAENFNALTIDLNAGGDNLVILNDEGILKNDTVIGSAGTDTIVIANADTITGESFAVAGQFTGIEVLSLASGSTATLDNRILAAGISTLVGDAINVDASTLATGFSFVTDLSSGSTITGGTGSDTIYNSAEGDFADSGFAGIRSTETLVLRGDTSVELGASAQVSGIRDVIAGEGTSSIAVTGGTYNIDLSASQNGVVTFTNANDLAADTIVGSEGTDAVVFTASQDILDSDLAHVTGVEILAVEGNSSVELGSNVVAAGIESVVGGGGNSVFNHTEDASAGFVLDGSTSASNEFIVANGSLLVSDTILGGEGIDAIILQQTADLTDADLANISNVEILAVVGNSSIELGANAVTAGLQSVVGGGGNSVFVHTEDAAAGFVLDGSTSASNEIFLQSAGLLASDTIIGGSGTDAVVMLESSDLSDADLENMSNVEILAVVGNSSVELGANAVAAGLQSVVGGGGNSVFNHTNYASAGFVLDGSTSASNEFIVANVDLLVSDTILGGEGTDAIILDQSADLTDADLANISNVEILAVVSNSSVELGANAIAAGIQSVVGAGGNTVFNHTEDASAGFVLDGTTSDSNEFIVANGDLLVNDTILGGEGTDAIILQQSADLADGGFANIHNTEILAIVGNSSVELGANAVAAGIESVVGGGGNSVFNHTESASAGFFLDGSTSATNEFRIEDGDLLASDTIFGGVGADQIVIQQSADLSDADLANISNVETLVLTGNSSVELDANAVASGIQSVVGGIGTTAFMQTDGSFYLDGSTSDSNLFIMGNADMVAGDTIKGGDGIDAVTMLESSDLGDADLANMHSIEILAVVGNSSVELGANAMAAGIQSVVGGGGNSVFNHTAADTLGLVLDGSTSASNLFLIGNADLLVNDTILGGSGTDAVVMLESSDLSDVDLANLNSTEILAVVGNSSVELGANAIAAGIQSVVGGGGNSVFNHTDAASAGFVLDGSTSASNVFTVANGDLLASDTILGGVGTDAIILQESADLTDSDLANIRDTEILAIVGNSSVQLSANAVAAGIQSVVGGGGNSVFMQTAGSFYVDGSTSASNLFVIGNADLLVNDTILGGSGTDAVVMLESSDLSDADLANLSSTEILAVVGNSSVELGANAMAAGIVSVVGGGGNSVFDHNADNTLGLFLDGSTSASNEFTVANADLLVNDTILGGSGTDAVILTNPDNIADSDLVSISGVEILAVTGNSSVELGANAVAAGIRSVVARGGGAAISQTAGSFVLDGSSSSSNLFILGDTLADGVSLLAGDTVLGGAGTDALVVNGTGSIGDSVFANVHGVEILAIGNATEVTLGSNAQAAGIDSLVVSPNATNVDASAYTTAITIDASENGSATITAGVGNDTLFAGLSSTLTGGEGADLFILNGTASAVASITDFTAGTDALELKNYGAGASDYSLVGSGAGANQLFYGDTLVANLNFSGSEGDILTNARFI